MIEQKEKMDLKEEDSQVKIRAKGDSESAENEQETGDKPPEKMTKSELVKKIQQITEEYSTYYDLYLRSQAEMENIKKRARKEKEDWIKFANETLIKEILPVMDNLEMAISHSNDDNSLHALREGVELTLKGLKDSLAKSGLEEVKAQGEPFDPCFHEAVSELVDDNVKPGTVIHELQKGYILNQRLIRPSMVVVSRGGVGTASEDEHEDPERACENS